MYPLRLLFASVKQFQGHKQKGEVHWLTKLTTVWSRWLYAHLDASHFLAPPFISGSM